MLDLIIFIKSDGENANPRDFTKTVTSLEKNIGIANYRYYFVLNARQEKVAIGLLKKGVLTDEKILKIKKSVASWAYEYNLFFSSYGNETNYILVSHDDLVLKTSGLYNIAISLIKDKVSRVGWMTFTCDHYYRNLGKPWGVSARMGFAKDRHKWPYIYECHKFDRSHEGQSGKHLHLLDMPQSNKLVKIHAAYSCFNMISSKSMAQIGLCEDWSPYTILIDEDWGLTALKNNLYNIWIPDVYYNHPLNASTSHKNRYEKQAHAKFIKKWGFDEGTSEPSIEKLEELRKEHKDNLLTWSSNYNTYDWQYL